MFKARSDFASHLSSCYCSNVGLDVVSQGLPLVDGTLALKTSEKLVKKGNILAVADCVNGARWSEETFWDRNTPRCPMLPKSSVYAILLPTEPVPPKGTETNISLGDCLLPTTPFMLWEVPAKLLRDCVDEAPRSEKPLPDWKVPRLPTLPKSLVCAILPTEPVPPKGSKRTFPGTA